MMREEPITVATPPAGEARPRRSWATRVVLLVLLALVVAGTAWLLRTRAHAKAAAAAATASAMQNRVVPVLTAEVTQRDVPVWLDGLGSVAAFYTVTVKTLVDGRIDKVFFQEGQHVKQGDLLVQVDPRPFAIQLETAEAALARDQANARNARLNLDRYKTLTQQNLIAVQQFTDQEASVAQLDAQVRSDQAQIDAAKLNLTYAHITSPIDGVTGVRLVDPGNIVHPSDQTGLVVVTQLDPIAVFFTLPEDDLPAISKAASGGAKLAVEAYSRDGDTLLGDGTLSVIDNLINQQTATIRLKAIFSNPQHLLWPNQFVKARIRLATRQGALVVPAAAVQHGPNGTFVYVVDSAPSAQMRPVVVEGTQGELAILQSGVAPGDQVVVEGQAQIRPGSRVAPRPASSAGHPPGPTPSGIPSKAPGAPGPPRRAPPP